MTFIAKEFPSVQGVDGLSRRQQEEHYALYTGYITKCNELTRKLREVDVSKGNATYADAREIKIELAYALDAVKSHELYFGALTQGAGGTPVGKTAEFIERDFGGFGAFRAEMTGTVMSARGWAWLAYDRYDEMLHIYIGDTHHTYPIWDAAPIFAFDAYEHAYFMDYGTARAQFIYAVFRNLDWSVIEDTLQCALRGDAVTK
ncbi:MAG TPA: Fe-Mn family superoxide dismutase, partial [Armatimonadota bacterium]|nr:Fe-Mn family superoxide dismutase [Armatimonadota bacterium]